MTEQHSSIIDQPVTLSSQENLNDKDKFGISRYEYALTEFIKRADTPLTIALQGEWGSGKTSLMNLLKYHLCEAEGALYYSVWINTWQHSILSNPESSIIGILQSIIYQLGNALEDTEEEKKRKISPMIGKIGKIASIYALNFAGKFIGAGNAGNDINQAISEADKEQNVAPITGDSQIAELKKTIAAFIKEILAKENAKGRRGFLFFIDDLDRIDPPFAVQILELLKNIFDLEHCIYVLAIDYDVVVKGLKPKFGELTDKNAREFRSFFDKIIQLPFAMPVSSYRIDTFLIDALSRIGYLTPEEQNNEELKSNLTQMAMYSVGTNPRSLKRLTNILSLIQLMTEEDRNNADNQQTPEEILLDKQVNFALVCLQIIYPLVYNTLLEYPSFRQWGDDNGGDGKTLVKKLSLQELTEAEQKKLDKQGDDFDEPWERILFRVCLKDNYLSSRVVDISRLLNKISDIVPKGESEDAATAVKEHDEAVASTIERLIRFSAVTNVHTTEETVVKKIEDFNPSWWLKVFRDKFVPEVNSHMGDLDTFKCTNGRVQSKLYFVFEKQKQAGNSGADMLVTIGHDDKSYNVALSSSISFLAWGYGTIQEEEALLGCSGLHDSVVREIREYAAKSPEIKLNISDTYNEVNQAGQKYGQIYLHMMFCFNTLEEVIADESVKRFADFFSGLMRIRFKLIPEINALCMGHDEKLRNELKAMDLAPFTKMSQWYSQTYLDGAQLGNDTFGISIHLHSTGFGTGIWESHENPQKMADAMEAYPELKTLFPEHKAGEFGWWRKEDIPFDGIIDWLKDLLKLLRSLK